MDQLEAEFSARLMSTFNVEAEEHIKNISDGLLALEKKMPGKHGEEKLETIFREAHSLKGAARAVNLITIEEICQSFENVLADIKNGALKLTPPLFDTLYQALDFIRKFVSTPDSEMEKHKKILKALIQKLDKTKKLKKVKKKDPEQAAAEIISQKPLVESEQPRSIRVALKKLDILMQEVEEMLMVKMMTRQRYENKKSMYNHFKQKEKVWNHMQSDLRLMRQAVEGNLKNYIPSKEFLEFLEQQSSLYKNTVEELNRSLRFARQDFHTVSTMVDTLLEETKQLLMQPFSSLFEIFPRMVRDISHSLNKQAEILFQGGDIEVDRRILDEMKDPLIHLIRNCIDHGIETPEIRMQNNKSPQGTIILSVTQTGGNRVEIYLTDDGAGIDVEKIKKIAVAQGKILEQDAKSLPEKEAMMLIFKSGISTSPIVTELSGRGVGLGIVLEKVDKLGGLLDVESKKNEGTAFRIRLPLTLATFRGIHLQASGQDFIIPTHNVNKVLRIKPEEIKTIEGMESLSLYSKNISYIHLCDLLQIKRTIPESSANNYLYVIIIKAAETTLAIGTDKILNEQEIFVKRLGNQLVKVKNISAGTIMEWGKVIPILDPFDLVKSIKNRTHQTQMPVQQKTEETKKNILVVDDSVTARILLKNILESAGFHVNTAIDGAEAFSLLSTESFDLVVTDIEMPRLDGFKLTEKIRSSEKLKELPVILCTSRGSKEDREHGIEVGANAYLDKSSFAQNNLLSIVQNLM